MKSRVAHPTRTDWEQKKERNQRQLHLEDSWLPQEFLQVSKIPDKSAQQDRTELRNQGPVSSIINTKITNFWSRLKLKSFTRPVLLPLSTIELSR
jgi:hypothetical protein